MLINCLEECIYIGERNIFRSANPFPQKKNRADTSLKCQPFCLPLQSTYKTKCT